MNFLKMKMKMEIKLNLSNIALLLIVAVTSSLARAQLSEPVLGIPLGKQFKIIKCAESRANWCSDLDPKYFGANPQYLSLVPPDADSPIALPTWMKRETLLLELRLDGVADMFIIKTLGPSVQDRVVNSISGRFGKPTIFEKQLMQNAMGATIEAVFATWQTTDAVIKHTCTEINSCNVVFFTSEAYARTMANIKQREKRDKL